MGIKAGSGGSDNFDIGPIGSGSSGSPSYDGLDGVLEVDTGAIRVAAAHLDALGQDYHTFMNTYGSLGTYEPVSGDGDDTWDNFEGGYFNTAGKVLDGVASFAKAVPALAESLRLFSDLCDAVEDGNTKIGRNALFFNSKQGDPITEEPQARPQPYLSEPDPNPVVKPATRAILVTRVTSVVRAMPSLSGDDTTSGDTGRKVGNVTSVELSGTEDGITQGRPAEWDPVVGSVDVVPAGSSAQGQPAELRPIAEGDFGELDGVTQGRPAEWDPVVGSVDAVPAGISWQGRPAELLPVEAVPDAVVTLKAEPRILSAPGVLDGDFSIETKPSPDLDNVQALRSPGDTPQ